MDERDKDQIISALEKSISHAKQTIASLQAELSEPVKPDVSLGRLTRMDALGQQEVQQQSLEKLQLKVKKLEYTLSRIDDPEFGECVMCFDTIPLARLIAMPESNICVHCAALDE